MNVIQGEFYLFNFKENSTYSKPLVTAGKTKASMMSESTRIHSSYKMVK